MRLTKPINSILVLVIPFHLLWQIQINLRQKLILSVTLCLSIFMIIIALIRVSHIRIGLHTDVVWQIFWQQIEACMAVIIVSFSAFRSFFVAHASRLREDQNRKKDGLALAWQRRKLRSGRKELDQLPEVLLATMTNMQTSIIGGTTKNESHISSVGAEATTTLASEESANTIRVEQTISIELDEVSQSNAELSAKIHFHQERNRVKEN